MFAEITPLPGAVRRNKVILSVLPYSYKHKLFEPVMAVVEFEQSSKLELQGFFFFFSVSEGNRENDPSSRNLF